MKRRPFRPYLYDAAPADIRRTARAVGIDPHHHLETWDDATETWWATQVLASQVEESR